MPSPENMSDDNTARICVAEFGPPHGVAGLVKLRPFTETPEALADYMPLTDRDGVRVFEIALKSMVKGQWIAEVAGVNDRDAAENLRGIGLFAPRSRLPAIDSEDDFYHADLLGLSVELTDGTALGTIKAIHDFGAGNVLELVGGSVKDMIPFTKAAVPLVDLDGGRVVVDADAAGLTALPPKPEEEQTQTPTEEDDSSS